MRSIRRGRFLRSRVPPVGTAIELESAEMAKKYPEKVGSRCAVGPPVGTATDQRQTDEHSVGVARRNVASSTNALQASSTNCLGEMRKLLVLRPLDVLLSASHRLLALGVVDTIVVTRFVEAVVGG